MRQIFITLIVVACITASCGQGQTFIEPAFLVPNVDEIEFSRAVYIGQEAKVQLEALLEENNARFEAEGYEFSTDPELPTDLRLISEVDVDEFFFIVDGFYCTDGEMRLTATSSSVVIAQHDEVACAQAQPVSSIFIVDRNLMEPTFTVGTDCEVNYCSGPPDVIQVEDWNVVIE